MKSKINKKEKEIKFIIVRRHEPDEFMDLMLRLIPVFSEWQNGTKKNCDNKKRRVVAQRNES
jgi:hypothetical protein